jgi:hypothetical protein
MLKEPTSLSGGEGLVSVSTGEIGGVEGKGEGGNGKGSGGGRRVNEQTSTMMGLMSVSNSARPIR